MYAFIYVISTTSGNHVSICALPLCSPRHVCSLIRYFLPSTWLALTREAWTVDCVEDYECARLGWSWTHDTPYTYPREDHWQRTPLEMPPLTGQYSFLRGKGSAKGPEGMLGAHTTRDLREGYVCEKGTHSSLGSSRDEWEEMV
jgi:hypothetical protein